MKKSLAIYAAPPDPPYRVPRKGVTARLVTPGHYRATVRNPDSNSGPAGSVTAPGRVILRDAAAREGGIPLPPSRRSRLGMDLTKFAAWVVSQPSRRPRDQETRTLGPMPIDVELMDALDRYADRIDASRRQVVECLLHELLDGEPPATGVGEES